MNEKAFKRALYLFEQDGYKGSPEHFSSLLSNNKEALDRALYLFEQDGYKGSLEHFSSLMGVKKKEDSVSEDGTSDGSDSAYAGTIQDYVESEEFKQLEEQQQPQEQPVDPNLADIQAEDVTETETYGGTIQDFAESEEIQQMPTYEEQGQDLSPGLMAQSTPKQEIDFEKDQWIREQTEKARIEQAEQLERQTQAELEQLREDEMFQQDLEQIDKNLLKTNSVASLDAKYGKYGITFNLTPGRNGGLVVRTKDGSKSITIAEQNIVKEGDHDRLREFIYENATMPEDLEVKDEDYLTKAFNVKKSRPVAMQNEDGSVSTVLMASADNMAFPTIFPKDPNNQTSNPKDWFIFDVMKDRKQMDKAIQMAKERGELYRFDTPEEANEFAEGGWKDVSITDLEGDAFFKERGLDYMTAIKADRRFQEIKDELGFIEKELGLNRLAEWNTAERKWEGTYRPSEEVIKNNPQIYLPDGSIRSDISEKIAALEAEEASLKPIVKDDQIETALQDYNVYLQKRHEKEAQAAATINKEAKEEIEGAFDYINGMLTSYGVDKSINEMSQEEINNLVKQKPDFLNHLEYFDNIVDPASLDMKLAADTYYMANTYLNDKTRKHIVADFEENFAAVITQWNEGYARGNAVSIINAIAAGVENIDELTAQELSEYLSKIGKTQGRAFTEFMHGRTWKDSLQSWLNDPLEVTASLVANSFAQLLPIGWDIITTPKLAAPIVTAGVAGSFFSPVGTAVGVMSSLQGATAFGLEYGNSILEAARNSPKNYQIENPNDMLRALQDPEVWKEGSDIGIKRGLSIGAVETLTAGLAGKFFMAAKTASRAKKVGKFAAGSLVYDPLSEGLGEATAQVVSGQGLDWFEVALESLGGIGSNISTGGLSIMRNSWKNTNIATAYDLTKRDFVAKSRSSFSEISNWASKMQRLGQIDESVADAIQENLELRKEARDLLNLSKREKNEVAVSRAMDLLKAQKTLNKDENSRKIYKDELASIETELAYIVKEGKLAPEEMTTDIDNIQDESGKIVSMQPEAQFYKINGKRYTKANFKKKLDRMSEKKKKNATFEIKNDEEFKAEIDQQFGVLPTQEGAVDTAPSLELDDTPIVEEFYENEESIPTEIKEAKSTQITPQEDGKVRVEYNEDEVFIDAPAVTKTFDSKEAIPQEVMEVVGEENVVEKDGKFIVTYKEVDALEALLGRKKKEAPVQEEVAEEFENIADDDTRTFSVESIDEIPEQYRDRAEQASRKEVKTRKTFFGIPIGKETTTVTENFTFTLTGKEIKEQQAAQKEKIALEEKSKKKEAPQFQLETQKQTEEKKEELKEQALQQMEEVMPETAETVDTPEPGKVIPVTVKENTALAKKLKKVGLDFLIGKKINLVMADQLKVDKKRMGGPFFPLIDKLFKKIAWASIDTKAAARIVTGAMKSDYSVVYNMNPDAIDSNSIMGETLIELLSDLSQEEQQNIFSQMKENVLASNAKDFKKIKPIFKKAKTLKEAFDNLQNLSVDERAALVKKVVPSRDVEAGTPIGKSLQKNGITIEKLREINSEQFVADLPAGALTMILEVRDKNGNRVKDLYDDINTKYDNKEINPDTGKPYTKKDVEKIIKQIKEDAIVTPEQQKKEDLPTHPNYDVYVRGEAVAMLNETTSFWNVIKDAASRIEKGIVGILRARTGKPKADLSTAEVSVYDGMQESKVDKGKTLSEKKDIIKGLLKKDAKKIEQLDENGKPVKADVIKKLKEALQQTSKTNFNDIINDALTPFAETRKKTARGARANEMRSAEMTASVSKDVDTPVKTRYQMFVEKITKAFPGVEVVTSQKEFDTLLTDLNAKKLATKDQKIYGAVYEGKLYLNPSLENFNTPIHEFGHIWLNTAKAMKSELYNKGIDLIKKSDYVKQIKENKDYQRVIDQMRKEGVPETEIDQYILEEALATAIGDKGESFATAAQQRNFKAWLTDLFNFVKKLTGISKLTANEVQNLNLDQFLQAVVVDIMSENPLFKKAEVSNFSNQLQLMSSDGTKHTMDEIIAIGRQNGFPDSAIKTVLKAEGFKTTAINKAMAIQVDMNTQMPDAFANVKNGFQLFSEIQQGLDNWLKTRWGKGKSFTEYRAKAMELLKENKIFQKQSKLNKNQLIVAMDTVIGRKKIKDVNAPINAIRKTLELLKKNNWKGNLKAIKKSINTAVKPLKQTKIHGKNLKKIYAVLKTITTENFEQKIDEIDNIFKQITKDNTAFNKNLNKDIKQLADDIAKQLEKKDPATNKEIGDIIKLVQLIKSKEPIKNIGPIKEMLRAVKGITKKNVDEKLNQLINAVTDLVNKQELDRNQINGLKNTVLNLKEQIKQSNAQAKNLKNIKLKVAQHIRQATMALRDLGVKQYTYSEVQNLVYNVKNATEKTIISEIEKIEKTLKAAEERQRKVKLRQTIKLINKYAAKKKTDSKRVKSTATVDAAGQEFFQAARDFVNFIFDKKMKRVVSKQDFLRANEVRSELKNMSKEDAEATFELIKKQEPNVAEIIKKLDKILVNEKSNPLVAAALDKLIDMDSMSLEQLNELYLDLNKDRLDFAQALANKKEAEKKFIEEKNKEAAEQIQNGEYSMLYEEKEVEENGKIVIKKVPIHPNTIPPTLIEVLTQKGLKAALQKMRESFKTSKIAVRFMGHLGTITNTLDNIPAGKNFFTENVYNRLNRAIRRHIEGMQRQIEKLDDIAASINPNLTYDKIKTKIFEASTMSLPARTKDRLFSSKDQIPDSLKNKEGVVIEETEAGNFKVIEPIYEEGFTGDSQMRIYALSKNEIQREKLRNMGYTDQVLLDIENNLDPEVKAFADKIVEYLSEENYDRLNNVYRDVNNVGLNKVFNYFPTKTISKRGNKKDGINNLTAYAQGNFQKGFDAQHESFLKDRVDLTGEIQLIDPNNNNQIGFTSELDNHLDGVERYIAFAQDVKILNRLFKSEDISNLLQKTKLNKLTHQLVNNVINPVPASGMGFRKIISNFVAFKIGYKLWQIPKQASSFVMSFPEYTNAKTSHLPRGAEIAANIPLYIADQIAVMATFRSSLKEAMATSPMLRERIMSFKRAGFGSLETSIDEGDISKVNSIFTKINKVGGYPTYLGDLLGVMGYWAVYKRDIENGMDPTKALEKFENYNKTQQSRRATDINVWQLQSKENPILLTVTTFASMPLLLTNQVMTSSNNMAKIIAEADSFPKGVVEALGSPDGLRFFFALGLGNALFVAASNMFKLYGGDEEDREEAWGDIKAAMFGWNNLTSIPFLKSSVEKAFDIFDIKKQKYGRSELMNPYYEATKDVGKLLKLFESKGFTEGALEATRLAAGYSKGINLEPIISLLYYQDLYGAMGVSKSYRPSK